MLLCHAANASILVKHTSANTIANTTANASLTIEKGNRRGEAEEGQKEGRKQKHRNGGKTRRRDGRADEVEVREGNDGRGGEGRR